MWKAAAQPSASTVIKTFRAEQSLLGGWQRFNEIRALSPEQKVVYTPEVHISDTLPIPGLMPSPNNSLWDPSQVTDAFGNSWTLITVLPVNGGRETRHGWDTTGTGHISWEEKRCCILEPSLCQTPLEWTDVKTSPPQLLLSSILLERSTNEIWLLSCISHSFLL